MIAALFTVTVILAIIVGFIIHDKLVERQEKR